MNRRTPRRRGGLILVAGLAAATVLGLARWQAATPAPGGAARAPEYVGSAACAACHEARHRAWRGSHHDLAMQPATEENVLGDFGGAALTHGGVTSTFLRRGEAFLVRTQGADGRLRDYEVRYTFGVEPLQQYLVGFPGGRYQVLGLCWDSRPAADGGQRWFQLYPQETIPPGDELHWTGRNQNWNFMCAACHSTGLRRNYDAATDTYATTFSEIDVACEACHGPGRRHVAWARTVAPRDGAMGLTVRLKDANRGGWVMDLATGTAQRTPPRSSRAQVQACATCHARRSVIQEPPEPGATFADAYRLRLLQEPLYFADGQIREEVYVYGSFLQSRMYRAGVTCSDCHDPHGLGLHEAGNALCARCHLPDRFDTPAHHFHEKGSAACVDCHMPARRYMVVDPRRDHSFRVPRPDLSVKLGTPNACTGCHDDRPASWAAEAAARWYGERPPHYGEALHAGRHGETGALVALIEDGETPAIVRATALAALRGRLDFRAAAAVQAALDDDVPEVRAAALEALDGAPANALRRMATPALGDPVRLVRISAARVLAGAHDDLDGEYRAQFEAAAAEYVASERANAERPESHVNLGNFHADMGHAGAAETAYRRALELDLQFVPAHVNLADLHRARGDDAAAERVLRAAIDIRPETAVLHHALGLCLVRRGRLPDAVAALGRAAGLAPDDARFGYAYAMALSAASRTPEAIRELKRVHERHPRDRDVLAALVELYRETGDRQAAARYEALLESRE